jgi:NAD+-dependent secondary alcohol dehydrogenase Adh1
MKAVRLHEYHQQPVVEEVPEPTVKGPLDVIVKIGGAGVCRTDLHIILGQWDELQHPTLPYTLGHENAGWVHEIGSAVTNVAVGDTVILHPKTTCGLCGACRAGQDMHCEKSTFPGLDGNDGGMAEYLLTSARACVKLEPDTRPEDVAALADAGITAYHAVRKVIPLLYPGTTCTVIGAGGLGHIGIQCLAALTATNIIVVDRHPDALKLAEKLGAHDTVLADGGQVDAVKDLTNGGADVVLDFVAEEGAENEGFAMTRPTGSYSVIGYGGTLTIPTLDIISTERNIIGNIVGTYNELAELMVLAQAGKVTLHTQTYPLDAAQDALADLDAVKVRGRAILVP